MATDPTTTPAKKRPPWLWIGIGAVVLLAAGVAVLTSGGDESVSVGTVPAGGTTTPSNGLGPVATDSEGNAISKGEVWPITATGTALAPLPQDGSADPAVGVTAPALSGFTFDGSPVSIDPSKGPVMLVFLAHWCPHCNREVPEFIKWKNSGEVPADLQVIAVTTAVDATRANYPPSQWIVDKEWPWPVLADSQNSDAAQAMGVSSFPFSVIVGTDGTVLGRATGELGQDGIASFVNDTLS